MQNCSVQEIGLWGPDTKMPPMSNDSIAKKAWRSGLKIDSLRVVASSILNGATRDSTLESLAAISPDSTQCIAISTYDAYAKMIWEAAEKVDRESVEGAKVKFISRVGGSVAIDGGWSHRRQNTAFK